MTDEELEKRLALIEQRAIRLELSRPGIGPGGDEQSGQPDEVELRVEALLNFLEECHEGMTQNADADGTEADSAQCSGQTPAR